MEKLKDFLYDKNDILVAFLVLIFAGLLIIWRMDAIMEYPEKMFAEENQSGSVTITEDEDEEGFTDDSQSQDDQTGESQEDSSQNDAEQNEPAQTSLWSGGVLTREVEVDVYGNSAMAAVNCLVDAGLFDSYAEYQKICEETGLNHEKVSAGTLTFAPGTTKQEIARKVNWS